MGFQGLTFSVLLGLFSACVGDDIFRGGEVVGEPDGPATVSITEEEIRLSLIHI